MIKPSKLMPNKLPENKEEKKINEMGPSPGTTRGLKRRTPGKVTLDDIFDQMQENAASTNQISTQITNLETTLNTKIDTINATLKNNIEELSAKIQNLENTNKNDMKKLVEDNRKYVNNAVKQQLLDCCMDIEGLKDEIINGCSDLKALVHETIASFSIQIKETDIEKAVLNEIYKGGIKQKIITATFADRKTKFKVIQEKKKIKECNEIFFNNSMTSTNNFLMRKAKKIARPANMRVVFYDCAVRAKKSDGSEIILTCEDSLDELEKYVKTVSTQPSTSS